MHAHTKKNNWNLFCSGQLFLGIGSAMWLRPSDTPLENTDFPLPNGYQLRIASRLGMGLCAHFPDSVLHPAWLRLCRPHSLCESKRISSLLCLADSVSSESNTTSGFYNLSSSSEEILSLEEHLTPPDENSGDGPADVMLSCWPTVL